jgi:hypothetical protein
MRGRKRGAEEVQNRCNPEEVPGDSIRPPLAWYLGRKRFQVIR